MLLALHILQLLMLQLKALQVLFVHSYPSLHHPQ